MKGGKQMLSKKILTFLAILPATAGVVTVAAVNASSIEIQQVQAAAPTNTRRIWIIDNNGDSGDTNWWTGSTLYAYVWNSNGSATLKVEHEVLSDYYKGLWYVDVTLAGATTSLNVIMRVGNSSGAYSWGNNNQTFTQPLGAFGTADTIWLNNGVTWDSGENRNSRSASVGTSTGLSAAQAKYLFVNGGLDTCANTNTNGYFAYPQLDKNFFEPTTADLTTQSVGAYTVQECIDGMELRYNANK